MLHPVNCMFHPVEYPIPLQCCLAKVRVMLEWAA